MKLTGNLPGITPRTVGISRAERYGAKSKETKTRQVEADGERSLQLISDVLPAERKGVG